MDVPILEACAVSLAYPRRSAILRRRIGLVRAVEEVSCAIAAGARVGLVGESGCGKTTLARLFMGLLAPSRGRILLHGRQRHEFSGAALKDARRMVQGVFQNPLGSLNPRLSVEETISEPLIIHALAAGGAARRRRVRELLARVQLPAAYAARRPRQLSGGECQRVGLARALAAEPEALICDEPIASLDVSVGSQVLELLRHLCETRRMALLFISHDLGAVASLCDRVAVMQAGRIVEEAPTPQLLEHPRHPYTEQLIRSARLEL